MPTYGKTGTGASWHTCESVYVCRAITLSSTETATKMSAYLRSQGSATNGWKMGLWDTTDDSLDYQSSDMSGFTDTTGAWRDATFTSSVVADTYWIGVVAASIAGGGNTIQVAYDTVASDTANYQTLFFSGTYPTLGNPLPTADDYTGSGTHDVSIYLETTAAGQTIAIGAGALSLTGYALALNASYPIAVGALSLTGRTPSLNSGWQLETGALSLTGYVGSLGLSTPIAVGNIVFTGYEVTTNLQLALQVGNLSLTGFSSSLAESIVLSIGSGSLSLTGYSSTLDNQFDFGAQGSLVLTGYALSLSTGAQTIPIASNILLLTSFAPTTVITAIEVASGQLSFSGAVPSLNVQVPIGSSDVLLSGLAPTLQTDQPILYGALILSGLTPSLSTSVSEIAVASNSLSFSGYAVSLITGYPTVDIGVGTLLIGGLAIGVEQLLLIRSTNPRSDVALTSSRSDMTLSSKRTST